VQYMLFIYDDEREWLGLSEAEREAVYEEYRALAGELSEDGRLIGGHELRPTATAKSVRVRNGGTLVTDGPFAETKEQLGGYLLVEAAGPDEALEIAARIPAARNGTIEVRPVVERSA